MASGVGQKLFEKEMTTTDVDHRLHWPSEHLIDLPDFKGGHQVDFTAKDGGGKLWKFRCSKRMTGLYDKPVVSGGWVPFLKSKENFKARPGDLVIFYRSQDPRAHFEIRLKRKVLLFGSNINDAEI